MILSQFEEAVWQTRLQRHDAPFRHFLHVDVKGGLIELDHIDANLGRLATCAGAKVPLDLLRLLQDKEILLGAIDVAGDRVETPEEVAETIERASRFVPLERLYPCTNCGMAPMDRSVAISKLVALSAGAAIVRRRVQRAS